MYQVQERHQESTAKGVSKIYKTTDFLLSHLLINTDPAIGTHVGKWWWWHLTLVYVHVYLYGCSAPRDKIMVKYW